jgi:hypothetical protein
VDVARKKVLDGELEFDIHFLAVIPAPTGIQRLSTTALDSRLRGNDQRS